MMSGETLHVQNLRQSSMTSSLFSVIILAYWDNVMGPMISKIWKGNDNVVANKEIINYVANHTLSGELCRQTEKHTIDPKLCILPGLGYIFNAYIFNGHSKMGPTISSLSFVMSYKDLQRYLKLQDYVDRQVKLIVLKYRLFQQKDIGSSIKSIAPYLKKLVKTVDTLQDLSIPNICVNNTIFGESDTADSTKLLDSKFLMRALTSHLQTCGCTIVHGTSVDKINLLIHTLSLFLNNNERYCSRIASEEFKHNFAQDLWLQGLVGDPEEKLDTKDALLNTYPITVIDVDEKIVKQMVYSSVYAIKRRDNLKTESAMLLHGTELPSFSTSFIFTEDFGDISILVQKFITELFAVPNNCNIRKNHIENFKQVLQRKASAMLSYVEARSHSGKNTLDESQLQRLKQDLCLISESDFRVVLATAEKLRPGLSMFLVQAIQRIDDNFQAILEAI